MINIPNTRLEREAYWNKHTLVALNALLMKNGYNTRMSIAKSAFLSSQSHRFELEAAARIPNTTASFDNSVIIKFRPDNSVYHYSFEISGCCYKLRKESRRFRYKNPNLQSLYDIVEYLWKKIVEEKQIEVQEKAEKEELQRKRLEEAKVIAKAIHCPVETSYNCFVFNFTTMDGRKIKMTFRLAQDGEVDDFEIAGKIKRHHFYSIIDSLRKSVPDNDGRGTPFVRKRRIDLTSDIITRIAKNENIKNLQFSTIRAWKRNFNLEEKI